MNKTIAIKIDYLNPRTNKREVETRVLTNLGNYPVYKIIEALQKRIKEGYVLDRVPSVSWQVCNDLVSALVTSTKL